jgi:hypothetical protein
MLNVLDRSELHQSQKVRLGLRKGRQDNFSDIVPIQGPTKIPAPGLWQIARGFGMRNRVGSAQVQTPPVSFQDFVKEISSDMRDLTVEESGELAGFYRAHSQVVKKLY